MEFGGNSPRPRRRRGCRVQNAVRCRSRWSLLDSSRQRRHRSGLFESPIDPCGSSSLAALSMRRRRVESTATVSSYTSVWVAAISKLDTSSEAVSGPRSGKRGSTRSGSGSQIDPRVGSTMAVQLDGFRDTSLLDVAPGIADSWSRDGLLLIGDAAHTASPIGAQETRSPSRTPSSRTVFSSRNSLARTEFSNAKPPPRIRGSTTCARRTGYFAPAARRDQSRVLARVRSLCPSTPRSWDDEGGQGDCPSFEVGAEHDRNVRTRSTFGFGRPISLH